MLKKNQRRKAEKENETRNDLTFRAFSVRASTVDEKERSVETVISTETPVAMYDYDRWERVPEILRADGAVFPSQVPMLDNHARWSTEDQIGSARSITKENNQIVGRLFFSSDATRQWDLVREGHLTDVSAGYQVIEKTFVPKNTTTTVGGRQYEGPCNVVTKWKLREVSLTPIGADEQAKLRGFDPSTISQEEDFEMNKRLRSLLESRGMPADLSDDDAQVWAAENNLGEKRNDPPAPLTKPITIDDEMRKLITDATTEAARKVLEEDRKQRDGLRSISDTIIKIAGVERCRELDDALAKCNTREEIEKAVLDFKAERQSQFPTSMSSTFAGPQQMEKFEAGMRTAIVERALRAVPMVGSDDEEERREKALQKIFPIEQRSKDAVNFRNGSLYDLARTYVEQAYGIRSIEYNRHDIAVIALFGYQRAAEMLGLHGRASPAYHVTGSFANITLDAMNKSMMLGYTEAPSTWEKIFSVGDDADDFKEIHRLRIGAVPNLPVWQDNTTPDGVSLADFREHYAIEARSSFIDFSWKLLVNDDMNALSRIPGQYGQACRRTVNKVAWTQITANAALGDGVALFSAASGARKRKNLETGVISNYTTAINTLTANMMVMRGENTPEGNESEDILSITPRYLAFPAALRGTLLQYLSSEADPNATHAGVKNINTGLEPVLEPLLDASSATAIYLFADKGQVDTGEVTFLRGQRTPVARQKMDEDTLAMRVYYLQSFGAKMLNHRGVQKHAGA